MEDKTQMNADLPINDQQTSPEENPIEIEQPEAPVVNPISTEEFPETIVTPDEEPVIPEDLTIPEELVIPEESVIPGEPTEAEQEALPDDASAVSMIAEAEAPIASVIQPEELPAVEETEVTQDALPSEDQLETADSMLDVITEQHEVAPVEVPVVEPIPEVALVTEVVEENTEPAIVAEPAVTAIAPEELPEVEEEHDEDEDIAEDPLETEEKYQTLLREELVTAMEEVVALDDISIMKRRIALIRVAFMNKTRDEKNARFEKYIQDGGEKEAYSDAPDALEERFRNAFNTYKDKKAAWEVDQEKLRHQNLIEKQHILEQLKELINSEESLKKTYDEFRELQEKWSHIGMVPRTENNNLWQNYHFLVEKFFDKVKINRELRDLDLKRNLEHKVALCEKVEELLIETSIDRSFRLLQQYHREWKEIGPVPMDKKDEVWERFKRTSDLINDKRREYYDQRQEELDKNLLAKKELCEQAEGLVSSEMTTIRHWQDHTDKINELFKIWKSIGPAAKAQNDEVWNRFRSIMEAFFAAKKDFYDKLKDEQINNYNMKLDLCVQAESLKFSTDWRKTSQELINLQKRWKEIGPVPRKHSDKIWKRFRAACDDFFAAKSAHFSGLQGKESENLRMKEDLIKRVEAHAFTDDKSENLETIKGFQREWMEIGHVPINDKDRIQKTFRDAIDSKLKDLNISSVEMNRSNYRTKLDSMRDNRDGGKMISRERMQIQNKIAAIQEEINLWENNLGFFAESKKAQILKEEFAKKINKAKQEVALLEAKLKMLREVE